MLRIKRIALENFGPFRGTQTFDLAADDGVVIVYGENMRGKTSLLNGIRYALFGRVISRGERAVALHQIGNWDAAAEGTHGFKVVLTFDQDGKAYELTRLCRKREGVTTPQTDYDYIEESFLACDGTVLGPDAVKSVLAAIMPEKVSRFFLFDGELLQQYEELLRDESDMGRQIKDAIERILGVPILTNGRSDLSELHHEYQKQEARAAQKDQKTQQLGLHHARLLDERSNHEKEVARHSKELESLRERKVAAEEELKKTERIRALLGERDKQQHHLEDIERRLTEKESRLKDLLIDAWRWVLKPKVNTVRQQLQSQIDQVRNDAAKQAVAKDVVERMQAAVASGTCGTCQQSLSVAAKEQLARLLVDMTAPAVGKDSLQALMTQMASLDLVSGSDGSRLAEEMITTIDDLKIDRAKVKTRLTDLADQTRDLDESAARKLSTEFEKTVQEIGALERGIKLEDSALATVDENIKRVQEQLAKLGGADVTKERQRRELCSRIAALLTDGVTVFRDALKSQVEEDASDLFRQLTTEPDYQRLSINDSYGLTIVHKDGQKIPVRSAGAEHIVALSLLGALQRNAPLRGPIVMDSPFGRLDHGHTTRVVRTLPSMAPQVVLLVYESELDPQAARDELRPRARITCSIFLFP